MNDTSRQEFHRKALASAIAVALVPSMAYGAAAGRVDFAYGDVKGVDAAGQERRLRKGAEINQGDTVITARGRAQIRFTDGARTSLLPNSEFKVETYEFEEQAPEEAKGFFSLLKGGLRTITGAIGRLRDDAYQVNTPVATIGIRGTEYLVVLGNSASMWVGAGVIIACNGGGCTRAGAGESLYVANEGTKAIKTDQKPVVAGENAQPLDEFIANDAAGADLPFPRFRNSDLFGGSSGAFYSLAVSVGDSVEGSAVKRNSSSAPVSAAFLGGVALTQYRSNVLNGGVVNASVESTVVGDNSNNGVIGWTHWFGGTVQTDVYGSDRSLTLTGSEGHHAAIGLQATGIPQPSVSGVGSTARYDVLSNGDGTFGTRPGYANGQGSGRLTAASLNVDFYHRRVGIDLSLEMPRSGASGNDTFSVNNAIANLSGGTFSYSGNSTTTGTACSGGCSSYVEGFLAGPSASHAGIGYKLNTDNGYINGAAGFKSQGLGTGQEIIPSGYECTECT